MRKNSRFSEREESVPTYGSQGAQFIQTPLSLPASLAAELRDRCPERARASGQGWV
ncbi:MAG: hypothetical protein AW11_02032 [Candidatus Accumulibacter regalis]|uniref:Uncharacterized protein n=1 Tax=Accumulibacter regalis TaxID=522306 RepID=A0A011QGH5_ACCRE|nr:MAG: hypothetical protein AW11_02032 [Candidatus Accumulibacter regalis]